MSNANVLEMTPVVTTAPPPKPQASLGSQIKLRKNPVPEPVAPAPNAAPPVPGVVPGAVAGRVIDTFHLAYENITIYDRKIEPTGGRSLRAELTVDTEERVFNAISATAFLIMRNSSAPDTTIDTVELFMKTTTGGSAGRFKMTRADAEALNKKTISQHDYFIKTVIY
jgi:hypothetical protein